MKVKNIFLVIATIMLLSPTLLFFCNTNQDEKGSTENLEPLVFNKKRPFEMFDNYYKYHFAFRKILSQQYIDLKNNVIKVSSLPDKVINGKDGWYFLGNSYDNIFSASLGVQKYSDEEIKKTSDKIYEMKHFCDSLGIKFYYFIAPNSNTIYKEYLPIKPNNTPRKYDLIKSALSGRMNVIDPRSEIIAGKKERILYYKTDTHWNRFGAWIGVQEVLKAVQKDFPKVELLKKEDFTVTHGIITQMDLTKMLGVFVDQDVYDIDEKVKSPILIKNDTIDRIATAYVKNTSKSYRGFMYRDSFGEFMMPFFNTRFQNMSYFATSKIDKQRIIAEKPDFIIYEIVERKI
ncbi:MAG: hypothetical protein ABI426_04540 [Flavobacterium sp.]